ncbi:MAG TPA: antibiotic biosynthesis monooxygenase [Actinomycetes bacterium]
MFVVHNRIEVPAEGAEAFEQTFIGSMRTALAGVPGLRRSLLMRPAGPNAPYISTMEFDSQDDFRAWMKSDSFTAAHSDKQAPGMQAPSAIELFTVIEDLTA